MLGLLLGLWTVTSDELHLLTMQFFYFLHLLEKLAIYHRPEFPSKVNFQCCGLEREQDHANIYRFKKHIFLISASFQLIFLLSVHRSSEMKVATLLCFYRKASKISFWHRQQFGRFVYYRENDRQKLYLRRPSCLSILRENLLQIKREKYE